MRSSSLTTLRPLAPMVFSRGLTSLVHAANGVIVFPIPTWSQGESSEWKEQLTKILMFSKAFDYFVYVLFSENTGSNYMT